MKQISTQWKLNFHHLTLLLLTIALYTPIVILLLAQSALFWTLYPLTLLTIFLYSAMVMMLKSISLFLRLMLVVIGIGVFFLFLYQRNPQLMRLALLPGMNYFYFIFIGLPNIRYSAKERVKLTLFTALGMPLALAFFIFTLNLL